VTFDAEAIRQFATLCGDHNPLHHNAAAAAAGPFGALIASGPHVVALMMGLDATFLSQRHEALGLGFEFRFVKAVVAGTTLTLEWTVSVLPTGWARASQAWASIPESLCRHSSSRRVKLAASKGAKA